MASAFLFYRVPGKEKKACISFLFLALDFTFFFCCYTLSEAIYISIYLCGRSRLRRLYLSILEDFAIEKNSTLKDQPRARIITSS